MSPVRLSREIVNRRREGALQVIFLLTMSLSSPTWVEQFTLHVKSLLPATDQVTRSYGYVDIATEGMKGEIRPGRRHRHSYEQQT